MRTRITVIELSALLLILIVSLVLVFFGGPKKFPQDAVIVALGDSLTRGYGMVAPGKNFVTFLSEDLKIPIINAGKTGDTTSDALVRLNSDVIDKNPDVVMILLGGNDYFEGKSVEVIEANIETIIENIKKRTQAKIILIGGDSNRVPAYEKSFAKMALSGEVDEYVPNVLSGISLRRDLLYDGVHPNERGHRAIADKILPVLEKVLREI